MAVLMVTLLAPPVNSIVRWHKQMVERSEDDDVQTRHPHFLTLMYIVALLPGCGSKDDRPSMRGFTPTNIALREVTDSDLKELVDARLTFIDSSGVKWIAPQGTLTDGASVPRLALWITDGRFDKEFLKAAVVHDAYCQEDNETRCPDQYRTKPWKVVHRMFFEACLAGGTSLSKARIMFVAVWIGGPRWNDPDNDLQIVPSEVLRAGFDGCKKWIEDTDPTLEEIESWMDKREPTILAISNLESTGLSALRAGDLAAADAALQQSEELLTEALDESPNDLMLLNLKGYHHKNWAINYRELDMGDKADEELDKAEKTFQEIITSEPQDPNALNGLGSVLILRNDLGRAEEYVRKALEIEPNYPAAKHDLELIEGLRKSQPPE